MVAGALALATPAAGAAPGPVAARVPAPAPEPAPSATDPTHDITLVTGDVVHVTAVQGGKESVKVTPAVRADGGVPHFLVSQRGKDLTVLPSDVAPLLPDRLDPALFDVTSLITQGFGDAQTTTIPLIATYDGAPPAAPATASPGGPVLRRVRQLPSIKGAAIRVAKSSTKPLGTDLDALAERPTAKGTGSLAGVRKLWLDARVKVALDPNLTQIGAPQAWDAGFDGTGVTVAVLDSGIDSTHPDLAGVVTANENFSDSADAGDHLGHGTHVASILAGRGTASGGARMGVAHGATLLNGKVIDDDDIGFASSVIAGMEWASSTEHAQVVNMSLGFEPGSSDGGPVTAAVDQLTAANHTLFVIAAGNNSCTACIGAPADAPSALTVGAVDGTDQLADFTSQGPVPGSDNVKPDITAPGVDIIGARAAGTTLGPPVGDQYISLSGTSMAAPHVAGAAAVLLQARGPMEPQDLKAALTDTAKPTAGVSVYGQGAGRLDIGRAITTPVVASPGTVDFGGIPFPFPQPAPSRTITYRNGGAQPVTLTLSSDTTRLQVSPAQLTVPAGGTATAEVAVDALDPVGTFGGTVTATGGDGSTVHTTVGFTTQPEMHDVHFKIIARDGRPGVGEVHIMDTRDGSLNAERFLRGDSAVPCSKDPVAVGDCIRLPVGTYSINGFVFTMPADTPSTQIGTRDILNTSLVGNPQLTVDKDTTVSLDARLAHEVTIATPEHQEARANMGGAIELGVRRTPQNGPGVALSMLNPFGTQLEERYFMQPTQQVTAGTFRAYTHFRLEAPDITFSVPGMHLDPVYEDPAQYSDVSSQYPRLDGTAQMRLVDAGTATAAELAGRDLHGALALVRRSDDVAVGDQSNNAAAAGARMVAVYNDGPGVNSDPGTPGIRLRIPTVRLSHEEGTALLARGNDITVTARGVIASPYAYELVYPEVGRIPQNLHHVAEISQLAQMTRHFRAEPGRPAAITEDAEPFQPGDTIASAPSHPLLGGPRTRTDYFVGDPDVRWGFSTNTPEVPYNFFFPEENNQARMDFAKPVVFTTFRPGERTSDDWLGAPIAPGLDPIDPLHRDGDLMHVHMAGFVDASGNFARALTSQFDHGFAIDFKMFADDQLVAATKTLAQGDVAVPAGNKTYRIEYEVDNDAPWASLSTRTHADWTFHSGTTDSGKEITQPLITADYDLDLDLDNRLPASQPAVIGLNLAHQAGSAASPITQSSLDYSTDDGASWQPAQVRRLGDGRYQAVIPHPTGFVSLRLHAADQDGGTLSQQVIRAFAVDGA